jgi:hypothetical protein
LLASKRLPHGIVCLESALMFHGILPTGPGPISIAIGRKAGKPVVNGQLLRFVRFGTTSKSEFDPCGQYLVGITINAPFAEQNHKECP